MRRRRIIPALVLAAMVALTGCVPVIPVPPPGGGVVDDRDDTSPRGACAIVADPGLQRLGDCEVLVVEGVDLTLEVGSIGTLEVRGDRIDIRALAVGAVSIEGQDNKLDVEGDIGSVTVRGDRNDVDSDGAIGSASVHGNDNEVFADRGIGRVDDRGDRNDFDS